MQHNTMGSLIIHLCCILSIVCGLGSQKQIGYTVFTQSTEEYISGFQ